MLYQYYYKRLNLFKIPYKLLLYYHSPLGNTIKTWTSTYMRTFILAVRNDIYILNIAYTILQLRKALNAIFTRVRLRGSLLIYAQSSNALKINRKSVITFVDEWIPGLITNYKRVNTMIKAYLQRITQFKIMLRRSQLEALSHITLNPLLKASSLVKRKYATRKLRVPSISLSILDSYIWVNECLNAGIPSIQVCDTQSRFDMVTYPIISNQRSNPLTYLIVELSTEVCNTSLLLACLDFISFHKCLGIKNFTARIIKTNIVPRSVLSSIFLDHYYGYLKHGPNRKYYNYPKKYYRLANAFVFSMRHKKWIVFRRSRERFIKHNESRIKPVISNKRTFIFNKRFFTYQVKDLIDSSTNVPLLNPKRYYKFFQHRVCKFIFHVKKLYNRLFYLSKKIIRRYFYRYYGKLFRTIIDFYHQLIIHILGLKKALSRKKRGKHRFITLIPFDKRDIKSLLVCSFMVTPRASSILLRNNYHEINNKLNLKLRNLEL